MRRVDLVLVAWALLSLAWLAVGYRAEKPKREGHWKVVACSNGGVIVDLTCYDTPSRRLE